MLAEQCKAATDGRQHAECQHVHFQNAELVQVILVPLDDRAVGHRGVLDGHQPAQRLFSNHETTDVLGKVPGEADDLTRQRQQPVHHGTVGIESRLPDTFRAHCLAIPPLQVARHTAELVFGQPQRPAHVANGTAGTVGDHGGRQRRPFPAVPGVDVLDHLLTPLVLEVHVNVRRLVTLAGHEAFKKQRHARGIHLGDAEAVTHHGIGRRPTTLAENALATGEADNVIHGQEIGFVAQFSDQRQLVFQQLQHLGRRARGPALAQSIEGPVPQPARRGVAGRHQLAGVLIAQFIQREVQPSRNLQRSVEQTGGIATLQLAERAQVPFTIRVQTGDTTSERPLATDGGQGVLHGTPPARMHVHVTGGHGWNTGRCCKRHESLDAAGIITIRMQFHHQPGAPGEMRLQPRGIRRSWTFGGQPQRQAAGRQLFEVMAYDVVGAFVHRPPSPGDQCTERRVAFPVGSQHDQTKSVGQGELAADEQPEAVAARRHVRPHDAGYGTLVGQRQRGVPKRCSPLHEFRRVRRAPQEREVAEAVQFGVGRHPKMPCRYQASLRRSR